MKTTKKIILGISYLFVICLLAACSSNNNNSKQVWIDNPTDATIKVMIDEQSLDIPANSGLYVDITAGKHKLTYNNQSVNFVLKPNDQGVVINPTLSNYIFYHEMYAVAGKEDKAEEEIQKTENAYLYDYIMNGDTVKVPFTVINNLFIEQYEYYWHFGVNEPYKDDITVNMSGSNSSSLARSKIFREKEFIKYMGDQLPQNFSFPATSTKLSDEKPYVLIPDSLVCDCPEANEVIKSMKENFKSLSDAKPEEMRAKVMDFEQSYYKGFSPELRRKCDSNPNSNYNQISATVGKNLSKWGAKNAYIVE